jgi:hypothetical protein
MKLAIFFEKELSISRAIPTLEVKEKGGEVTERS